MGGEFLFQSQGGQKKEAAKTLKQQYSVEATAPSEYKGRLLRCQFEKWCVGHMSGDHRKAGGPGVNTAPGHGQGRAAQDGQGC